MQLSEDILFYVGQNYLKTNNTSKNYSIIIKMTNYKNHDLVKYYISINISQKLQFHQGFFFLKKKPMNGCI